MVSSHYNTKKDTINKKLINKKDFASNFLKYFLSHHFLWDGGQLSSLIVKHLGTSAE